MLAVWPLLTSAWVATAAPQPRDRYIVPIKQVSVDLQQDQMTVWVEGDRLRPCNLGLTVIQQAKAVPPSATEIRLQLFHQLPTGKPCASEVIPFTLPLKVETPICPGQEYRVWVNDYSFTVERRTGDRQGD